MRPDIFTVQTGKELKRWYWLKKELVSYCKVVRLSYKGSKFEILSRMAKNLDGHATQLNPLLKTKKRQSLAFNWSKESLTLETEITDSYRNGPNVRKFFVEYCGDNFHFTIAFMQWMKANVGKNLKSAVAEWERLEKLKKSKSFKSSIPEGNQYNQYLRDFFIDNPTKKITDARLCWKLKRQLPVEHHRYEGSDLRLTLNVVHTFSKKKSKN